MMEKERAEHDKKLLIKSQFASEVQDRPLLSHKSQRLAKKKRQLGANKNLLPFADDNSKSDFLNGVLSESLGVHERLYLEGNAKKEALSQKIEEGSDKINPECTFQPKISRDRGQELVDEQESSQKRPDVIAISQRLHTSAIECHFHSGVTKDEADFTKNSHEMTFRP